MIELSQRDRTVLIFGGVFLFVFCIVQFLIFPLLDKQDQLKRALAVQDDSIRQMQALYVEHQSLIDQFDQQSHMISKRSKSFSLFSFLDAQAEKSRVKKNVSYMKPMVQKTEKKAYKVSKVKVKLKNVYLGSLVDFLYRVENSSNAVSITSLSLSKAGKKKDNLDAVIETQTYILKGSS